MSHVLVGNNLGNIAQMFGLQGLPIFEIGIHLQLGGIYLRIKEKSFLCVENNLRSRHLQENYWLI